MPAEDADWLAKRPFTGLIKNAYVAHGSLDEPKAFNYIEDAESAAETLAILVEEKYKRTEYSRLHAAQDIGKAGLPLESAARLLNDAEYAAVFGEAATAGG